MKRRFNRNGVEQPLICHPKMFLLYSGQRVVIGVASSSTYLISRSNGQPGPAAEPGNPDMATLLYKNHRISISTLPHRYTNRWSWSVVELVGYCLLVRNDRQKLKPIKNWFQQFNSKHDAEICAIEAAKTWVDKRLEHNSSLMQR
jgi:hypothetical protein